jgi:hypothetical protein
MSWLVAVCSDDMRRGQVGYNPPGSAMSSTSTTTRHTIKASTYRRQPCEPQSQSIINHHQRPPGPFLTPYPTMDPSNDNMQCDYCNTTTHTALTCPDPYNPAYPEIARLHHIMVLNPKSWYSEAMVEIAKPKATIAGVNEKGRLSDRQGKQRQQNPHADQSQSEEQDLDAEKSNVSSYDKLLSLKREGQGSIQAQGQSGTSRPNTSSYDELFPSRSRHGEDIEPTIELKPCTSSYDELFPSRVFHHGDIISETDPRPSTSTSSYDELFPPRGIHPGDTKLKTKPDLSTTSYDELFPSRRLHRGDTKPQSPTKPEHDSTPTPSPASANEHLTCLSKRAPHLRHCRR